MNERRNDMDDDELAKEIEKECFSHDPEEDHIKADELLVMHLRTLGFNKSADAFERVGKWYS